MRLMCAIWLNFNVNQLFFTGKNCAKQIDTESTEKIRFLNYAMFCTMNFLTILMMQQQMI
jgi:hypothetical protein